jgi:hypothetical protein
MFSTYAIEVFERSNGRVSIGQGHGSANNVGIDLAGAYGHGGINVATCHNADACVREISRVLKTFQ